MQTLIPMHTDTYAYIHAQILSTRQSMQPVNNASLGIILQRSSFTCAEYNACALGIDTCSPSRVCNKTRGSFVCLGCTRGFENNSESCVGEYVDMCVSVSVCMCVHTHAYICVHVYVSKVWFC